MYNSLLKIISANALRSSLSSSLYSSFSSNINLAKHFSIFNSSSQYHLLNNKQFKTTNSFRIERSFSDDTLEKTFQKAVANLQKVNADVDDESKLKLYSLYKQATNGPCKGDKPSVFDVVAKSKYQAWKSLGEMTKDEARQNYISIVDELLNKNGQTSSTNDEPVLVFEEKNQVFWIRLNRPKTYNALTPEMYEGIIDALKRAAENPNIKLVAVRGTGKYFSSGNDLKNFSVSLQKHEGDIEAATSEARDMLYRFVSAFIDFPKPIIGIANGPVFGILFTTMAMYDVVFASDQALFTCPFTKIGQTPEGCSTYYFPRIFGPSLASQLLYFNYVMSVEEAKNHGFVHKIVPHDKLDDHVNEWLYGKDGVIDQCYPNALLNAKSLVMNEDIRMTLHEVNKNECDVIQQQWKSEELLDSIQKFMSRK